MKPLGVDNYSRIVILTGAGVSAASGLPTFRGKNGLLTDDVAWLSDAHNLPDSLPQVWQFYGRLRTPIRDAKPNAAHAAVAELQQRRQAGAVTVITQNIDGLHQRAGCVDVVEMHGSLLRTRCTGESCPSDPFEDWRTPDMPPPCTICGCPLRLDVVLFNEEIPALADWTARRALRECDLFIATGTSGTVWPAANFVNSAAYAGARTVFVNKDPMEPPNPAFQEEYIGPAEELLPVLLQK
ncbi:MAG: SIR2 family NAD-dependent protein deacylase [Capsulimonadaceae bacterium]